MGTVCKRRFLAITCATLFVFIAVSPALTVEAPDIPSDLNVGPYVDRVVYKINEDYSSRILNLLSGETEIESSYISPSDLTTLDSHADISLSSTVRNGYGHLTINCDKYPLNISAFRRAFAYAFDKTRVTSDLQTFGILSQEHDSVVPYSNGWCIEDDLPYQYYTAQVATGAAILDAAGFTIDPGTGYRLAPDGSPFDVIITWSNISALATNIGLSVSVAGVDALTALDIDASIQVVGNFENLMARIDNNQDFDMVFYAYDFPGNDVDWLAYIFWGELADVPNENPCNFRNATYDSWRNQLLYGSTFEEVYEAAAAMQMILHENVPLVVVYENIIRHAYRTDLFTGYIEDSVRGIFGTWTLRKIHRVDGTPGGVVTVGIDQNPDTFNIYVDSNDVSSSLMAEFWPSLYLRGPDQQPRSYLAEHLQVETHLDNPAVDRGHTRFTVDIIQNATWYDGRPITAADVVYAYRYAFESGVSGNPAGDDLTNLVAAYAPTTHTAIIEFETESYWLFSNFAYDYIIPKHIFNDVNGIGYDRWNSWDPVFSNESLNVGSGPFILSSHIEDEAVQISANPYFCYFPEERVTGHLLFSNPVFQFSEVGVITVLLVGGTILNRRKLS